MTSGPVTEPIARDRDEDAGARPGPWGRHGRRRRTVRRGRGPRHDRPTGPALPRTAHRGGPVHPGGRGREARPQATADPIGAVVPEVEYVRAPPTGRTGAARQARDTLRDTLLHPGTASLQVGLTSPSTRPATSSRRTRATSRSSLPRPAQPASQPGHETRRSRRPLPPPSSTGASAATPCSDPLFPGDRDSTASFGRVNPEPETRDRVGATALERAGRIGLRRVLGSRITGRSPVGSGALGSVGGPVGAAEPFTGGGIGHGAPVTPLSPRSPGHERVHPGMVSVAHRSLVPTTAKYRVRMASTGRRRGAQR